MMPTKRFGDYTPFSQFDVIFQISMTCVHSRYPMQMCCGHTATEALPECQPNESIKRHSIRPRWTNHLMELTSFGPTIHVVNNIRDDLNKLDKNTNWLVIQRKLMPLPSNENLLFSQLNSTTITIYAQPWWMSKRLLSQLLDVFVVTIRQEFNIL